MTIIQKARVDAPKEKQALIDELDKLQNLAPFYESKKNGATSLQITDLNKEVMARNARIASIIKLLPEYDEYITRLNNPYPTGYSWRDLTPLERLLFPVVLNPPGGQNKSVSKIMVFADVKNLSANLSIPPILTEDGSFDWSKEMKILKDGVLFDFGDELSSFSSSIDEDENMFAFEQNGADVISFKILYILKTVQFAEALPTLPPRITKVMTANTALRIAGSEYGAELKTLSGKVPNVYIWRGPGILAPEALISVNKDNPVFSDSFVSVFWFSNGITIWHKDNNVAAFGANSGASYHIRATFGTFANPSAFLGTAQPA